ncbi:MAG: caspase family protein [Pseudonocardiaceae bacterium]
MPAVRNNLTDLAAVLTDRESSGFRRDHCTVLLDHADGDTVLRALFDNAKRATDTLVVYFAGHGLDGPRSRELYLTLVDTNPDDALWWRGALSYDDIRRVLLDRCRAANRVVLLDCCFSGRAIPETAGADTTGAFGIHGTYTLTAVGDNQFAYDPPGDAHTAFTGELLTVLRDGVPQGPELLTLNTVYLELDAALTSRDLHRPRQNNNDTVAGLALTRNPAYGQNEGRKKPRSRRSPRPARTGLSLAATPVTAIPTNIVYALAFSPDSGSLAVATSTNTVRVFSIKNLRLTWRFVDAFLSIAAARRLRDQLTAHLDAADRCPTTPSPASAVNPHAIANAIVDAMATTTMQLDTELRDQLAHIAQRDFDGATLGEALQRLVTEHRINRIMHRYEQLRADPDEWADYRAETHLTDNAAGDGLPSASDEYPEHNG